MQKANLMSDNCSKNISSESIGSCIGHTAPVSSLGIIKTSHSPSLYSTSEDGTLRIWDVHTQKETYIYKSSFQGRKTEIAYATAQPKNPFLLHFCAENRIYSLDTRVAYPLATQIFETKEDINSIDIHSNGSYLASADDSGQIQVVDIRAKKLYKRLRSCHDNIATAVKFRPHKPWELWSGGMDQVIFQWNFSKGSCMAEFTTHDPPSIAGSPINTNQTPQIVNPPYVHSIEFTASGDACMLGLGNGNLRTIASIPKSALPSGPIFNQRKSKSNHSSPVTPWAITEAAGIHRWTISSLCRDGDRALVTAGIDRQVVLWLRNTQSLRDRMPSDYTVSWTSQCVHEASFKVNSVCVLPRVSSCEMENDPAWSSDSADVAWGSPILVAIGGTKRSIRNDYGIEFVQFHDHFTN